MVGEKISDMADFDLDSTFIPALHKPASLLPIAKYERQLLYLIETTPVTIVIGQTGSGKTTQLPLFLEKAGWCSDGKSIGITQVKPCLIASSCTLLGCGQTNLVTS
jgi:ATP-dependent RNA helicase DDX35